MQILISYRNYIIITNDYQLWNYYMIDDCVDMSTFLKKLVSEALDLCNFGEITTMQLISQITYFPCEEKT